jgi:hypothetical protein
LTIEMPSPGCPIMLPSGTRTSVNSTRGELVARWPMVSIIPVISTPGVPRSTTTIASDSCGGSDGSVRQTTLIRSAPSPPQPDAMVV